jgi:hypothetical protein
MIFLGWSWVLLPVFVGAFAIGQFIGGLTRKLMRRRRVDLTSFLPIDLVRFIGAGRRPPSVSDAEQVH